MTARSTQQHSKIFRIVVTVTICQLMKLCLMSTYFQFKDSFYEQIEGVVMGSPLSPVVANSFMETLEERSLATATLQPKLCLRYVDDTFVIWVGVNFVVSTVYKSITIVTTRL